MESKRHPSRWMINKVLVHIKKKKDMPPYQIYWMSKSCCDRKRCPTGIAADPFGRQEPPPHPPEKTTNNRKIMDVIETRNISLFWIARYYFEFVVFCCVGNRLTLPLREKKNEQEPQGGKPKGQQHRRRCVASGWQNEAKTRVDKARHLTN